MEILKNYNSEILNFFEKFKDQHDYENHYKNLEKESEFTYKGEIKIKNISIPDIGPSEKLSQFHKTLKNWDDKIKTEVKYAIKYYEGGNIESLEEAMLLLDILILKDKNNGNILLNIKEKILTGDENDTLSVYINLLEIESKDNIIYGSLFNFLSLNT